MWGSLPHISLLLYKMYIIQKIKGVFLNERLILFVIVLNALMLFLQESGVQNSIVNAIELSCTIIFFVEMIVKM